MKNTFLLFLLFFGTMVCAQNTVTVEVTNIKNSKGSIGLAIYNVAETFTEDNAEFKGVKVDAKKGSVTAVFEDIPTGTYAIAVLHDKNNNDKMDFNLFGMPKEAYGFSNNAKGLMGPPKFEKASFEVKEGNTSLSIKVKKL